MRYFINIYIFINLICLLSISKSKADNLHLLNSYLPKVAGLSLEQNGNVIALHGTESNNDRVWTKSRILDGNIYHYKLRKRGFNIFDKPINRSVLIKRAQSRTISSISAVENLHLAGLSKIFFSSLVENNNIVGITHCVDKDEPNCFVASKSICSYIRKLVNAVDSGGIEKAILSCQENILKPFLPPAQVIHEMEYIENQAIINYKSLQTTSGNKQIDTEHMKTTSKEFKRWNHTHKEALETGSSKTGIGLQLNSKIRSILLNMSGLCELDFKKAKQFPPIKIKGKAQVKEQSQKSK